jgi:hypothetical protein
LKWEPKESVAVDIAWSHLQTLFLLSTNEPIHARGLLTR